MTQITPTVFRLTLLHQILATKQVATVFVI
jgi:hypothetical protein